MVPHMAGRLGLVPDDVLELNPRRYTQTNKKKTEIKCGVSKKEIFVLFLGFFRSALDFNCVRVRVCRGVDDREKGKIRGCKNFLFFRAAAGENILSKISLKYFVFDWWLRARAIKLYRERNERERKGKITAKCRRVKTIV